MLDGDRAALDSKHHEESLLCTMSTASHCHYKKNTNYVAARSDE